MQEHTVGDLPVDQNTVCFVALLHLCSVIIVSVFNESSKNEGHNWKSRHR